MQKKIIALAVAGLASTAAFAQSNVTVYGVADVYGANVGSAGVNVNAINSGGLSGSRLGFKGTEDLGGGTKALFTLEYALAVDGNAGIGANAPTYNGGSTQTRQSFVGLTGSAGTLIAGRLQTLVYNHNAAYNPTFGTGVDTLAAVSAANSGTPTGGSAVAGTALSAVAIGTAERLDNAVAYVAPAIGNLTLAGAYTAGASGTEGAYQDSVRASELSASYKLDALQVGYVGRHVNTRGATGNTSHGIGASYDFGIAKLSAQFASQVNNEDGATAATAASETRFTLAQYGAVVPVGANGAVIASYASNRYVDGKSWNAQALLYKHSLSKRTSLYGGIAANTADGGTATSTNHATLAGVTSASGSDKNTVTAALVGVNHSF